MLLLPGATCASSENGEGPALHNRRVEPSRAVVVAANPIHRTTGTQTGSSDIDQLSGEIESLTIGEGMGLECTAGVAVVLAVPQAWIVDGDKQSSLNRRRVFLLGILCHRVTIRCVWDSQLVAEWLLRFLPGVRSALCVKLDEVEHIAREVIADWSAPAIGGRS